MSERIFFYSVVMKSTDDAKKALLDLPTVGDFPKQIYLALDGFEAWLKEEREKARGTVEGSWKSADGRYMVVFDRWD